LNRWYLDGRLTLRGFVLNEASFAAADQLFLSLRPESGPANGFLIEHDTVERFAASPNGGFSLATVICDQPPLVDKSKLRKFAVWPVDTEPGQPGDQMVVLAGKRDEVAAVLEAASASCVPREQITGDLYAIDRGELVASLKERRTTIRFVSSRERAVAEKASAR
jgi:hypothetical protein